MSSNEEWRPRIHKGKPLVERKGNFVVFNCASVEEAKVVEQKALNEVYAYRTQKGKK